MTALVLANWLISCAPPGDDPLDFEYLIQRGAFGQVTDVSISTDTRLEHFNLGGMPTIDVWQDKGVSLIKFDVSSLPPEVIVKRAKVSLYCLSAGFSEEEINRETSLEFREMTSNWKEGDGTDRVPRLVGANIGTCDGKSAWPTNGILSMAGAKLASTPHRSGQERWYDWNLPPSFFAVRITKTKTDYGVMLVGSNPGKAILFASSENRRRELRPRLSLTLAFPIERMAETAIGKESPRTGVMRVSKAQALRYPENNLITVNIDWAIKTPVLFESEARDNLEQDTIALVKMAQTMGPALHHISLRATGPSKAINGQTTEVRLLDARYDQKTIAGINWKSLRADDIFDIADSSSLHPAVRNRVK